ncbi:MAG TPA: response regulator transcription factor [Cyclobacteriaceae bacterium]|nr:response regulator transcription factor [Cyclobacteriaceae bacterium]
MISVLIADDHAIVRRGIKQLLLETYPTAVIGEAGDAESLNKKMVARDWDVVICDLNMPGRSGLDAVKQIKQSFPEVPVLIMSMYPPEQYAGRALKAGASGYLSKESIHDDLVGAIRTVMRGKKFITPSIAETLVEEFQAGGQPAHANLSDRELDVLKALAAGQTVSEIAKKLSLSLTTISTYRARVLKKMRMRSNAELARYAFEKGLV